MYVDIEGPEEGKGVCERFDSEENETVGRPYVRIRRVQLTTVSTGRF